MLESMLAIGGGRKKLYPNSGPGPISAEGTDDVAYFGTVSNAELFTAAEFTEQVTELQGVAVNRDELPWHKFLWYGKILFIKQYPIFYNASSTNSPTSWKNLYKAGLIYGEDNDGTYPFNEPVNQFRMVKKSSYNFKVRTITGDETGATTLPMSNGELDTKRRKSMFTELIYRMFQDAVPNYPERKWAKFIYQDLISTNLEVTRELLVNTSYPAGLTIDRGLAIASSPYVAGYSAYPNRNMPTVGRAWRPVLELMSGKELFAFSNLYASMHGFMKGSVSDINATIEAAQNETNLLRLSDYSVQSKNIIYIDAGSFNVESLGTDNIARLIDILNQTKSISYTGASTIEADSLGNDTPVRLKEIVIQPTTLRYLGNPQATVSNPT
jgi:hypothetical protein